MKNKLLLLLLAIIIYIPCFSADKISKEDIAITFTKDVADIPDVKGYLVIKNTKTNKTWKMTYKDFLILNKGYKNWRAVSENNPEIVSINEDEDYVNIIFTYYDEKSKSILSGKVIVGKRYLVKNNSTKENILIGTNVGTAVYAILITILFLL